MGAPKAPDPAPRRNGGEGRTQLVSGKSAAWELCVRSATERRGQPSVSAALCLCRAAGRRHSSTPQLARMPPNHLILYPPLLLLPPIPPSIRVFSDESVLHIRWPKYWSFSFSISLANEYSGLIFFRMDWLDLLADDQFSSVSQSCPTLCGPMNRSRPGLPVHHKLPEFTQTHAH